MVGDGDESPAGVVRPLTTENVVADHARFNRTAFRLAPTLLRTRSVSGRPILAHVASRGRVTAAQLESLGERADRDELVQLLDPGAAGAYARVLAHQPGTAADERAAIVLFDALVRTYGQESLARRDVNLYGQLLGQHRRRDELLELISAGHGRAESAGMTRDVERALWADLHNPFLYTLDEDQQFLRLFNEAIDPGRSAQVGLRTEGLTPFDRLRATQERTATGPLITVVTSAFNPDHALLGAARSLIAQTWQNWEMVIVDDASTSSASHLILREAERLDPRIRVIRKAVNGGTYRARNTALMQARGSYMTFLDSDDWAHPERLEEGVQPMLRRSRLMATRSFGARVTESLELTRPGYRALFSTAAALMFRVPEVPARIGFFDSTRKSADTEYSLRIEAAFGHRIHEVKGRALTIVRRAEGTLSAADFSFGWQHQSRWAYKQAYRTAHQEASAGRDAFVEPHEPSPYYGAHRWARPGDAEYRLDRRFDVVLAGDWRRFGGPQVSMLEEIAALRAGGHRVGVMHLEAMRFRTEQDQPLCLPLRALLRAGDVELVLHDDDVRIDLLIVRYPPVLQFPPVVDGAVRPKKLFIMANQAPSEPDGSDQRYVPADVHHNAAELFGVEPRWLPQSGTIREILKPSLPAGALAAWDNPGVIDAAAWFTGSRDPSVERVVIGRHSRDTGIKFPRSREALLAAYAFPAPAEVRFLGASNEVARLLGDSEMPENWTVLEHGARDAREFVAELDVVVYMDDPDANEAFGRVLLESAASGALVVASPKHEENFGDALLYAEPEDVCALVMDHLQDSARFRAQVELSRRRVEERWSHAAFRAHIRAELDGLPAEPPSVVHALTPPAGQVTVTRPGAAGPVEVRSSSAELSGIVVPLRRLADGESADYLVVVHHPRDAGHAARCADRARTVHRPGTPLTALQEPLPPGVHALVHHSDRQWQVRLSDVGRADTSSAACHLTFQG